MYHPEKHSDRSNPHQRFTTLLLHSPQQSCIPCPLPNMSGPRGLMDKASDFESEDCEFESRRGRYFVFLHGDIS